MAKDETGETLTQDDKFELLIQALLAQKQTAGVDLAALKELLAGQATAMQKAMKPENNDPPMHSAMSYPEGDRDRPRADILTHEFFYNNFPVHKFPETHRWRELELARDVKPGEYTIIRKDGSLMTVSVKGEVNAKQELTKVVVEFPISREEKWLIPPMSVVLYQLVYPDNPRRRFMEAMQEFLQMTMGDEVAV